MRTRRARLRGNLSLLRHYCPIKLLIRHGRRRRKNCALFVAEIVTDLFVPSSVMPAAVTQPAGVVSVPTCSNAKPAVSTEGQETITAVSERSTESIGRAGK